MKFIAYSDDDDREMEDEPKVAAKVKKVSLRGDARNFTSIHGQSDKLIEQRQKAEELTLSERLKTTRHDQVEHVKGKLAVGEQKKLILYKGGKVFTLERQRKTRDEENERKKKAHMKDRRKGSRSAQSLLKKHRPSGMGKNVKK